MVTKCSVSVSNTDLLLQPKERKITRVMINKLWISEVEGRGYQQSVPCVLKMHKTRKYRHNFQGEERQQTSEAPSAAPPAPHYHSTIFTSTFTGYSLYFIMDYLRFYVIVDEGWIARDSGGSDCVTTRGTFPTFAWRVSEQPGKFRSKLCIESFILANRMDGTLGRNMLMR